MTRQHEIQKPRFSSKLLIRMLAGATIAFVLITVFLLQVDEPDPEWPRLWYIRPLIVVALAGAAGGLFFHLMNRFRRKGGWQKIAINILCVIVYVIGLWLGTVLGLDGTLWN